MIISHWNILVWPQIFESACAMNTTVTNSFPDVNTQILTHRSSVWCICKCAPTNDFAERWSSALFKLEHLQTLFVSKNIWVEMLISFLKFSLHILNMNVLYVLLNVYSFGAFMCFRLIGVTFTWGRYLDLSMRSTGVSFLFSLHCRRS